LGRKTKGPVKWQPVTQGKFLYCVEIDTVFNSVTAITQNHIFLFIEMCGKEKQYKQTNNMQMA